MNENDDLQKALQSLGGLRRNIDLVLYGTTSGKSNYDYISDEEYWERIVKFIPKATRAVVQIKEAYGSHLSNGANQ